MCGCAHESCVCAREYVCVRARLRSQANWSSIRAKKIYIYIGEHFVLPLLIFTRKTCGKQAEAAGKYL